jgi:ElaB/YqjD/DUF883 family membrane-anchored ribosome-binding protein
VLAYFVSFAQGVYVANMNATRELREEVEDLADQANEIAQRWHQRALNTTRNAARTADHYVHDYTWTSIAIAAILGCVIGAVVSRSRR